MENLSKIERKTKRESITNLTIIMGLGIIPLEDVIETAHLRYFGHAVRFEGERYPKNG
jgi:hypothetical protein